MDEKFTLLIYKKLKRSISDAEFEELSSWLLEKDEHLAYFQDISSLWELKPVDSHIKAEEWIKFVSKMDHGQTASEVDEKVVPIHETRYSFMKVAAVFLLLLGSVFALKQIIPAPESTQSFSALDQKKMKLLPDGSIVWLNKNSAIKYASNFKSNRLVELDGEAYFEVEKMNGQPFIVKTNAVEVTVLGTKFNVLNSDIGAEVAVTEGKVQVLNLANENEKMLLVKDDKAVLDADNSLRKILTNKNELYWHTGDIVFDNTPLSEVISIIERNFDVKVLLSPQINDCLLSGKYNSVAPEDVLNDVKDVFGFEVTENQKSVWKVEGKSCSK